MCYLQNYFAPVVAKNIQFPNVKTSDKAEVFSHKRKLKSYQVKLFWYQHYANRCPFIKSEKKVSSILMDAKDKRIAELERLLQTAHWVAEQSIRRVVIDRKITQGTRSDWGNRWQERLWSVLSTCAQTGMNVITFLRDAVDALRHGTTHQNS